MLDSKDNSPLAPDSAAPNARESWRQDREFAALIISGDREACEKFAARMAVLPLFLRTKSSELGCGLSHDELNDLSQDVLVLVWRRLESFLGHSTLETWACAIGFFELMNYLRRKQRRLARERGLAETVDPATEDQALAPGDPQALNLALAALSSDDAKLLRLKHEEGLSFAELGDRLGVTTPKIKHRYYAVLDHLRSQLKSGRRGSS